MKVYMFFKWYRNEGLRVAFIHVEEMALPDGTVTKEYYSKLVKADIHGRDQVGFTLQVFPIH
jgi:callose synthase